MPILPSTLSGRSLLRTCMSGLLERPHVPTMMAEPIRAADLSEGFLHRFGVCLQHTLARTLFGISPSGQLEAYALLCIRWFLVLLLTAVLVLVPLRVAATFLEEIAALFHAAAFHLFAAVCWTLATIALLAVACTIVVGLFGRK